MLTYFKVLLYFVIPPIILLIVHELYKRDHLSKRGEIATAVLTVIAVLYTTPWDNYLVATGVWFYDPSKVSGIFYGYVPLEEYLFFILETVLVALFTRSLMRREEIPADSKNVRIWATLVAFAIFLSGVVMLFLPAEFTYLGLILSWAMIPVMLQLFYGADILLANWKVVLTAIAVPTIYLSVVDAYAISQGVWTIALESSTGVLLFGILPIEEAIFFLVTSILVTFGLYLGVAENSMERLKKLIKKYRKLSTN